MAVAYKRVLCREMIRPQDPLFESSELDLAGTPYPPYISTGDERHRWNVAHGLARSLFEDEARHSQLVWTATRAIYDSDVPT